MLQASETRRDRCEKIHVVLWRGPNRLLCSSTVKNQDLGQYISCNRQPSLRSHNAHSQDRSIYQHPTTTTMSDLPRYIYDTTTKHTKDALRQPEFEVRLPEDKHFWKIHWDAVKNERSYTRFIPVIQYNSLIPVKAPEPYYVHVKIEQLVALFGDRLPSWIWPELSDKDKEFVRSEFKDLVQDSDVSALRSDLPSLSPTYLAL